MAEIDAILLLVSSSFVAVAHAASDALSPQSYVAGLIWMIPSTP